MRPVSGCTALLSTMAQLKIYPPGGKSMARKLLMNFAGAFLRSTLTCNGCHSAAIRISTLNHYKYCTMTNLLKMIFAPYFCLRMIMAVACSSRSAWHPGLNGFLVLGAIHILLIVSAYFLAVNSMRNGTKLSRGALAFGLGLSYFAGLVIFLFVL